MATRAAQALEVALNQLVQCITPTPAAWQQRQELVSQHIQRLQSVFSTPHPIRICPFGSSLSGLTAASSDIDLGLFGSIHGCVMEGLHPKQAKDLLLAVLRSVQRAGLVQGRRIQPVLGARIPVLKYTCALSGLDCDISLQGTGALVKGHFMALLNRHIPALSPLYRLVKLWAGAHDINDASRSTLNSTSLLYLTIFFLQARGLLPPLQALAAPELLNDSRQRLLAPANKRLWDNPDHLRQLMAAAEEQMVVWLTQQQQQRGSGWDAPHLGELLPGFFEFWADMLTDWVAGRQRSVLADLWAGEWVTSGLTDEPFAKDYLLRIQDPFDASDNPARAIGTPSQTNGNVAGLITYLVCGSSTVCQRYLAASAQGPEGGGGGGSGSSSSTTTTASLRQQLCGLLAWLFGPDAVLLLSDCREDDGSTATQPSTADDAWSDAEGAQRAPAALQGGGGAAEGARRAAPPSTASAVAATAATASAPGTAAASWAGAPFEPALVRRLLHQQQQKHVGEGGGRGKGAKAEAARSGALLSWLVKQLGASIEDRGEAPVLCLGHLQALNRRVQKGKVPGPLGEALTALSAAQLLRQAAHDAARQQQRQQQQGAGELSGGGGGGGSRAGPAGQPGATSSSGGRAAGRGDGAVAKQDGRQQQQRREGSAEHVLLARQLRMLDGPALPAPDGAILQVQAALSEAVEDAAHDPAAVQQAVQHAVAAVAARLQQLGLHYQQQQHQQHQHQHQQPHQHQQRQPQQHQAQQQPGRTRPRSSSQGVCGFGLQAVLEQHSFVPVLQQWSLVDEQARIQPCALPLPHQVQQQLRHQQQQQQPVSSHGGNGNSSHGDKAHAAAAAALGWPPATAAAAAAAASNSAAVRIVPRPSKKHMQPSGQPRLPDAVRVAPPAAVHPAAEATPGDGIAGRYIRQLQQQHAGQLAGVHTWQQQQGLGAGMQGPQQQQQQHLTAAARAEHKHERKQQKQELKEARKQVQRHQASLAQNTDRLAERRQEVAALEHEQQRLRAAAAAAAAAAGAEAGQEEEEQDTLLSSADRSRLMLVRDQHRRAVESVRQLELNRPKLQASLQAAQQVLAQVLPLVEAAATCGDVSTQHRLS